MPWYVAPVVAVPAKMPCEKSVLLGVSTPLSVKGLFVFVEMQ
ncbi:hypothetical protein THIX_20560 [Thiomonas sp. X19]|nr:hypothetical protein THIX_20560 [Thiomonas sp. X19]